MAGIARGEQIGEPGLEQRQLDAEHDRRAERAERGAGEHPQPAFEQAARAVEQQEGDEERPEREQQPGDQPHQRERAERAGQEERPARRRAPSSSKPGNISGVGPGAGGGAAPGSASDAAAGATSRPVP